jgi:hypothetical protein
MPSDGEVTGGGSYPEFFAHLVRAVPWATLTVTKSPNTNNSKRLERFSVGMAQAPLRPSTEYVDQPTAIRPARRQRQICAAPASLHQL